MMKVLLTKGCGFNIVKWLLQLHVLVLTVTGANLAAQSSTAGNTFISGGFEAAVHGFNHSFQNGGSGTSPGIVQTDRSAPQGFFSFIGAATASDQTDEAHVDGYVKKYGNTVFTFPIGDGVDLRALTISAPQNATDEFAVAWIAGDPSVTTDPTNGNTNHPITSIGNGIESVSALGQWDWVAFSGDGMGITVTVSIPDLSAFASASDLRLVGWNGSEWILLGMTGSTGNAEDDELSGVMLPGIEAVGIGRVKIDICEDVDLVATDSMGCSGAVLTAFTVNETGGGYLTKTMSGTTIDPATGVVTLGANTSAADIIDTIIYTLPNACADTVLVTIFANPIPVISDPGILCADAGAVLLEATPTGGTFSGLGVMGDMFSPAVRGTGKDSVFYEYVDPVSGCTGFDTLEITVAPLPAPVITPAGPFCADADPFMLAASLPDGTYSTVSGTGVSALGLFDPSAGTQDVIYAVTDATTGCTGADTTTVTVNPKPTATLDPVPAVCEDGASITLVGMPSGTGGVYSGSGVTGNTFDPTMSGTGPTDVTFIYTDPVSSCADTATITITVNATPTVMITAVDPICENADAVALTATPTGGTFTGDGVTGSMFDPAAAGTGITTVTYAFTDMATGCMAMTTLDIQVLAQPNVAITDPGELCSDAAPISLVGVPSGGAFSGPGITGDQFDPSVGTSEVFYEVTGSNMCTAIDTLEIVVNPTPVIMIDDVNDLCVNGDPVMLSATPAGGTFNGAGVSGTMFDPGVAGVGMDEISYTVTVGTCSATRLDTIVVNGLPAVTLNAAGPYCVSDAAVDLGATPLNGIYSGPGIVGGQFDPAAANIGPNEIMYSFSDANGCADTATISISVNATPMPVITPVNDVCVDGTAVTLQASPGPGTFSGTGVSGGRIQPHDGGDWNLRSYL